MDVIFGFIDYLRVNAEAITFCIGFPVLLMLVFRGDGPSVGGSASQDCDGDGGGD